MPDRADEATAIGLSVGVGGSNVRAVSGIGPSPTKASDVAIVSTTIAGMSSRGFSAGASGGASITAVCAVAAAGGARPRVLRHHRAPLDRHHLVGGAFPRVGHDWSRGQRDLATRQCPITAAHCRRIGCIRSLGGGWRVGGNPVRVDRQGSGGGQEPAGGGRWIAGTQRQRGG